MIEINQLLSLDNIQVNTLYFENSKIILYNKLKEDNINILFIL